MIWGVGLNYRDHAAETGRPLPECADVVREVAELGHRRTAIRSSSRRTSPQPDYEGELAVVIGTTVSRRRRSRRRARRASPGVTIAHDVSARDHQYTTGQWSWSKSFDTFCPLGPEVVSLDEVDLASGLAIETRVSGEVLQSSNTSRARVLGAELIAWISQGCTLEPGDVILTGTPARRRRRARTPPRWLRDGDVVEITIEGVGTLAEPGRTHAGIGCRA